MNSIEIEVRRFLSSFVSVERLTAKSNLFEAGFLTSLFAAQLIAFLEAHFKIQIPDEELEFRNFATLEAISGLVDRLRPSAPAPV